MCYFCITCIILLCIWFYYIYSFLCIYVFFCVYICIYAYFSMCIFLYLLVFTCICLDVYLCAFFLIMFLNGPSLLQTLSHWTFQKKKKITLVTSPSIKASFQTSFFNLYFSLPNILILFFQLFLYLAKKNSLLSPLLYKIANFFDFIQRNSSHEK